MNQENQVSNLELSKKLRVLEVEQESIFYWLANKETRKTSIGEWVPKNYKLILRTKHEMSDLAGKYGFGRYISAFTVAELGEILPQHKVVKRQDKTFWITLPEGGFTSDESEANARAKMLIYLIENDLIQL